MIWREDGIEWDHIISDAPPVGPHYRRLFRSRARAELRKLSPHWLVLNLRLPPNTINVYEPAWLDEDHTLAAIIGWARWTNDDLASPGVEIQYRVMFWRWTGTAWHYLEQPDDALVAIGQAHMVVMQAR